MKNLESKTSAINKFYGGTVPANIKLTGFVVSVSTQVPGMYKVRLPAIHGYCDPDGNNCTNPNIPNDDLEYIPVDTKLGTTAGPVGTDLPKLMKGDHVIVEFQSHDYGNPHIIFQVKPHAIFGDGDENSYNNNLVNKAVVAQYKNSFRATDNRCQKIITDADKIPANGKDAPNADKCGSGGRIKDGFAANIADFLKIVQDTDGKIGSSFVNSATGELFEITGYVQKYTKSLMGTIRSSLTWIKAEITKYVRKAMDLLVKAIMQPIKGVNNLIRDTLEDALAQIGCAFNGFDSFIQNLIENLLNSLIDSGLNAIFGCLDTLVDGILNQILQEVMNLINTIIGGISQIAGLIGAFGDLIGQAINAILAFLGISCGGAGDCTASGEQSFIAKFNTPGEYGITPGLLRGLNPSFSGIDSLAQSIINGSFGLDAAFNLAATYTSIPLPTGISLPSSTTTNACVSPSTSALSNAFSIANGLVAGGNISALCNLAPPTIGAVVGTPCTAYDSTYAVSQAATSVPAGSNYNFTVTRNNTSGRGVLNFVAYKDTADTVRISAPPTIGDVDVSSILGPSNFGTDSTNPSKLVPPTSSQFFAQTIVFNQGVASQTVTIPTNNIGPPLVGYTTPGIYLDLLSVTGNVTVDFIATQSAASVYTINIPGNTASGAPIPVINKPFGAAPVTTSMTLAGGQVYGPITKTGPGTLYVGNEVVAGVSGSGSLTDTNIVIEEGGDDWDDMIVNTSQGRFVNATSASSFPSTTNVTFTAEIFRAADDADNSTYPGTHTPDPAPALNKLSCIIDYTSSSSGAAGGPAVIPPVVPAVLPAVPGPAAAAPPGVLNHITYTSTSASAVIGSPIVLPINKSPTTDNTTIRVTTSNITAIDGVHFTGGSSLINFPAGTSVLNLTIPTISSTISGAVDFSVLLQDETLPAGATSNLGGSATAAATTPGAGISYNATIFPSGTTAIASGLTGGCTAAITITSQPATCIVTPDTIPLNLGVIATTTVAGYTLSYQWQRTYDPSIGWTNVTDGVFTTTVSSSTIVPIILASGVTPSGVPFVISGTTTVITPVTASCAFTGANTATLTINPLSYLINDEEYYRCLITGTPLVSGPLTPTLGAYTTNSYIGVTSSGVFTSAVACAPVAPSGSVIVYSGAPVLAPPVAPAAGVCVPFVPITTSGTPVSITPAAPSPVVPASPVVPVATISGATSSVTTSGTPVPPATVIPPTSSVTPIAPIVGPGGGIVSVPIPTGLPPFKSPPLIAISGPGVGATAKATLNQFGYVDNIIVVSPGFGYGENKSANLCGILDNIILNTSGAYFTSSPTVYVDGDSSIASAAIDDSGRVVEIRITNPQNKTWDYIPRVEILGGSGLGATATAVIRYVDCATVADEYLNIVNKYNTSKLGTVRVVDCP